MIGDNNWIKHVETLSEEDQKIWNEIYDWTVNKKCCLYYKDEKRKQTKYGSFTDKIVECEECSYFFKTSIKDSKSKLCPSCQWERDKELTRKRVKKYREKKM